MRVIVRWFFRTLRIVIGPFMLLWERLTRPRGIVRAAAAQAEVDRQCRDLVLYEFRTCPFCIKVRQEMHRLALPLERRDAQHPGPHRDALVAGGGKAMVPCLRITEAGGDVRWLYESGAIIDFLRNRFGNA
ncbi:MAG: glutathione S-transferase N-terminal domain-containing protein [Pseudomonadota bacterium]|jgi:glutaredoxin